MDLTIGVHYAGVRIFAHAGRAHVVPAAAGEFGPGVIVRVLQVVHDPDAADIVLAEQPMANNMKYPNTTVAAALKKAGLEPVKLVRFKVGAVAL